MFNNILYSDSTEKICYFFFFPINLDVAYMASRKNIYTSPQRLTCLIARISSTRVVFPYIRIHTHTHTPSLRRFLGWTPAQRPAISTFSRTSAVYIIAETIRRYHRHGLYCRMPRRMISVLGAHTRELLARKYKFAARFVLALSGALIRRSRTGCGCICDTF